MANLLVRDISKIQEWISKRVVGELTYWVCEFSESQHSDICGSNPHNDLDPVTGQVHTTCSCRAPKIVNLAKPLHKGRSIGCEMNKFDDMMTFLSAHNPNLAQVIAVDADFWLFTRAWCVSELATAHAHTMGMKQNLKLLNVRALQTHSERLRSLQIENMEATRRGMSRNP